MSAYNTPFLRAKVFQTALHDWDTGGIYLFVCLFVYAETHFNPDETRLEHNAQARL